VLSSFLRKTSLYVSLTVMTSKGFFFSAEISEISLETGNLVTIRETLLPDKKIRLYFNLYIRKTRLDTNRTRYTSGLLWW
jgi:hypothetical protein